MSELSRANGGRPSQATVLHVDDDFEILELITPYLEANGLRVIAETSPEAALRRLEITQPDLIIADVMMPEMDGYSFCRQVRDRGLDAIPFIFCSRLEDEPRRIQGLQAGADDYIAKPICPEELTLKARALVKKHRELRRLRGNASSTSSSTLSGIVGDTSATDLLQIAGVLGWEQTLVRVEGDDAVATVHLRGNRVVHARYGQHVGVDAVHRFVALQQGRFQIEPRGCGEQATLDERVDSLLLDAVAQLDEARRLEEALREEGPNFIIRHEPDLFMRRFDSQSAHVLSSVAICSRLDSILRWCELPRLETLSILRKLLDEGVIRPGKGPTSDPIPPLASA